MSRPKKSVEAEETKPVETPVASESAPKEKAKTVKAERVSVFSKGRFTLFSVGDGFVVQDSLTRILAHPATYEEGEKLVRDLNR